MLEFSHEELLSIASLNPTHREEAESFDFATSDIKKAVLVLACVLLAPTQNQVPEDLWDAPENDFETWMQEVRAVKKRKFRTLINWRKGQGLQNPQVAALPLFLYNVDFKETRQILSMILQAEAKPPPYLSMVCINMLHQVLGISHTELRELCSENFVGLVSAIKDLFSNASRVENWLQNKKQSLRFYGGETNTVLGMYDRHFTDVATGFSKLNTSAEQCFDLGGGFATSEISRLARAEFTSVDMRGPSIRAYDPELVFHEVDAAGKWHVLAGSKREEFLDAQERVPYLPFDVQKDSFPQNARTYAIVSTGFMTSTVRPAEKISGVQGTLGLAPIGLSLYAIARVAELLSRGDVDLLTIQRATRRNYRYKTCFFQWRSGRLVALHTTEDLVGLRRHDKILQQMKTLISPTESPFLKYI